jgi:hypothetical protein
MPMPEDDKLKKPKPPRATDDYMIVDADGNVYQGIGVDGVAKYGHQSFGETFRHRSTAASLMSQSRIRGGRTVFVVPMSQLKPAYQPRNY